MRCVFQAHGNKILAAVHRRSQPFASGIRNFQRESRRGNGILPVLFSIYEERSTKASRLDKVKHGEIAGKPYLTRTVGPDSMARFERGFLLGYGRHGHG